MKLLPFYLENQSFWKIKITIISLEFPLDLQNRTFHKKKKKKWNKKK